MKSPAVTKARGPSGWTYLFPSAVREEARSSSPGNEAGWLLVDTVWLPRCCRTIAKNSGLPAAAVPVPEVPGAYRFVDGPVTIVYSLRLNGDQTEIVVRQLRITPVTGPRIRG